MYTPIILQLVLYGATGFIFPDPSNTSTCSQTKPISEVNIPQAMDINVFDSKIVGLQLSEMYHMLSAPPRYIPDINYFATFHKINDTHYTRMSIAETPETPSTCTRGIIDMSLVSGFPEAKFHIRDRGSINQDNYVQVMWSTCPERYVWSLRCQNYFDSKTKCLSNETYFGLYIKGTPDGLPLEDILTDFSATGVTFAAKEFKWSYTYGENRLCH